MLEINSPPELNIIYEKKTANQTHDFLTFLIYAQKLFLKAFTATSDTNKALYSRAAWVRNPHPTSIQCVSFDTVSGSRVEEQMSPLELSHSPTMRYFLPNLSTMSALQHGRKPETHARSTQLGHQRRVSHLVSDIDADGASDWMKLRKCTPLAGRVSFLICVRRRQTHTALHTYTQAASAHHYFVRRAAITTPSAIGVCYGSSPLLEKSS
jgi:hypothetical protein